MNEQFWWYVARASGIVSWGTAGASVLWGTALATRALGRRPRAPWLLDLHRFLAALALVFVAIHLTALAADSYVHFGVADLLVPWASSWREGAVAWGVIAFYLLIVVEVTSVLMRHLPRRWWRRVHLSSYVVYGMASIHTFTAGADSGNPVLRGAVGAVTAVLLFLMLYRALGPGKRPATTNRVARPGPGAR